MQHDEQFNRGRRRCLATLGAAGLAAAGPGLAWAQQARPIRMILPVGVGSGVDTITRAAGPALTRALGASVVVENVPGAGGILGTSAIVREAPDGHTLGMVSNNHVIFPSVYKSVPFDPLEDITPISVVGASPFVLVAAREMPADNAEQMIALLRDRPGSYNYASSGNGTVLHLAVEMFLQQADVEARHIPYRGVGPMMTDLMSGQVQFGVLSLASVLPHLQSGALKAIGACGAERSAVMPELSTLREQGLPDYDVAGWFALIGPAGMAADQAERIYQGVRTAFEDAEVQRVMQAQGNDIAPMSPDDSKTYFKSEMEKYAAVVAAAAIEPQ